MIEEHYYVITHSNKFIGRTVKEARISLGVNGRVLKTLFELEVIKRIDVKKPTVQNNGEPKSTWK